MSVFTNCGFETGDLTNWDTTNIVETGDGNSTITASTGSATYGTYGAYLCSETGSNGTSEILMVATVDLTDLDTLSFDYAIPIATVSDSEQTIKSISLNIWIRSADELNEYDLITPVYYDTENPPSATAWTHVDYDCSALSGNYTIRVMTTAYDFTSGG